MKILNGSTKNFKGLVFHLKMGYIVQDENIHDYCCK